MSGESTVTSLANYSLSQSLSSESTSSFSSGDGVGGIEAVVGCVTLTVAVCGFGSFLVPVKKFQTGDGLFYQFIMCTAIWCCGFVANCIAGFPKFEPLSMLGGFLWCTGNVLAVPIIKLVGLALGMCIWAVTGFLIGWSSGTFGIVIEKQEVSTPAFNYIGAALTVCAIVLFSAVKSQPTSPHSPGDEYNQLLAEKGFETPPNQLDVKEPTPPPRLLLYRLTPLQKRILGVGLAITSGILYGFNFLPTQYLIDHNNNGEHSTSGIDYVFSHFTGIHITSTLYLVIYCIVKRNRPNVFGDAILPGVISGCIFGLSEVCMFVANASLMLVVTYPISATVPPIIASVWGILVFKEITHKLHIILLICAFCVTSVGVVFVTLSKTITL